VLSRTLNRVVSNFGMALRLRSPVAPLVALMVLALLSANSLSFVSPSVAQQAPRAQTQALQQKQKLLVAGNALLLAGIPTPAHAGGMFDFGLTLPFVAVTFLLMMVTLNALWYNPVTTEMDDRNAKLLQTLSEATDMLTKADQIQVEYTEQIREAREKASKAVAEYRQTTEAAINAQINAAKRERDNKAAEAKAKLDAEVQQKIQSAEAEIEKRKNEFVKESMAAMSL